MSKTRKSACICIEIVSGQNIARETWADALPGKHFENRELMLSAVRWRNGTDMTLICILANRPCRAESQLPCDDPKPDTLATEKSEWSAPTAYHRLSNVS